MKKIFLLIGMCIMAFVAGAQTTDEISDWQKTFTFDNAWANGGAQLWYEDGFDVSDYTAIQVQYTDADISNGSLFLVVEYADGTEKQQVEEKTNSSGNLSITFSGKMVQQIYLMAGAGNYVENTETGIWEPTTFLTTVMVTSAVFSKESVTIEEPESVITITIDDLKMEKNGTTNYQGILTIPFEEKPAAGDYVTVKVTGKVTADFTGLNLVIVEQSGVAEGDNPWWNVLSDYKSISGNEYKAGDEIDETIQLKLNSSPYSITAGKGVVCSIFTNSTPVDGLESIYINATGVAPVEKEPAYVDPVLGKMQSLWGDNEVYGKVMNFITKSSGIGFANYDGGFDLSQYKYITFTLTEFPSFAEFGQILVVDVDDNSETFSFEGNVAIIDLSDIDTKVKQLYFQCGGVGEVTLESIEFSTEPLAISSLNPAFSVVDGVVYSAGEITVYNIVGKPVATASQVFDVNSLSAGVYFIVAQEGTIKFVK